LFRKVGKIDNCQKLISIANELKSQHAQEVKRNRETKNREYLQFIIENLLFLGKQGLALRGHEESSNSKNKGNFLELINFTAKGKPQFEIYIKEKIYLSPEIQNELLNLLANNLVRKILPREDEVYSVIMDETLDMSKIEQIAFCLRYVSEELIIYE